MEGIERWGDVWVDEDRVCDCSAGGGRGCGCKRGG